MYPTNISITYIKSCIYIYVYIKVKYLFINLSIYNFKKYILYKYIYITILWLVKIICYSKLYVKKRVYLINII